MKSFGRIIINTGKAWWNSDPLSAGAAVAYYAVFSIPSFLVLIIAGASVFIDPSTIQGTVIGAIRHLLGANAAIFMNSILISLYQPNASTSASIISTIVLIFGALGVFLQIQVSLDKIWNVPISHVSGLRATIKKRLLALLLILCLGCLIITSSIVGALWTIFGAYINRVLPHTSFLISFINATQLFAIIAGAFAIMYGFVPSVKVSHSAALIGGIVGSLLFALGHELISLYLTWGTSVSAYGAASTLIVILVWIYYSSQIFFFGAALTCAIDQPSQRA